MKHLSAVWIEKLATGLKPESKDVLVQAVRELPEGNYRVVFEEMKRGYTPTRYKYYFGHVLQVILLTCGKDFTIWEDGAFVPVRTVEQVHFGLKMKYCTQLIMTPFGAYTVAKSTTELTDSDFINQFEEQIIAEFSAPPFGCDFMDRQSWAEMMKNR